MRWDLWNPWARWYELHSTHPLVAHRLRYLSNQSNDMGLFPYIEFDQVKPESYWDEFLVDFFIFILPLFLPLGVFAAFMWQSSRVRFSAQPVYPFMLSALGIGLLIRSIFSYPEYHFPEFTVSTLLSQVKVSNVRPISCTVRGKVIGRGVPGYLFSEDFVLQDDTGIIFLDMRQPLGIWELLFAIIKAGTISGKEVVAKGWYHRAPVPYIELFRLSYADKEHKSYVPICKKTTAIF